MSPRKTLPSGVYESYRERDELKERHGERERGADDGVRRKARGARRYGHMAASVALQQLRGYKRCLTPTWASS